MTYDILIKNSKIIDGAGNPWYAGEIGIKEGKIVKIRSKLSEDAIKEIDASGLITCPGFIDAHSHSDTMIILYSKMDTFIRQGITSAVVGMCGGGLAPVPKEKFDIFKEYFSEYTPMGGEINIT